MQVRDRVHDHDIRIESSRPRGASRAGVSRVRDGSDGPHGIAAGPCPPSVAGRCRRTSCCGSAAAAIPRTGNTGTSRRARRPHRRSARRAWSCRCRRCPTAARCSRGRSPCRPASRRVSGSPVETRSFGASCSSSSEVTGSTVMPSRLMRNGYSLVPCVEPRYFTTRMRRVEIWSCTRWSSEITASVMYSSRPWRVNICSPRSAVIDGGDAAVAHPAEQAAQFRAQDRRCP